MADTYCGKNCEECSWRERLECPGCKNGPGGRWQGECELAKCCRDKAHVSCDTCINNASCGILQARDRMPEKRIMKREAQEREKEDLKRKSVFLGKWFWILFWMVILANVVGVLSLFPFLYLPGKIVEFAASLGYSIVLLRMAAECHCYKTAGICGFIAIACSIFSEVSSAAGSEGIAVLVSLPGLVVGLIQEYNEYKGHEIVLAGADNELSDKWARLWKWYVVLLAATLGSILIALCNAFLGMLVVLVGSIGGLVLGIVKWVYLDRTARTFRDLAE